MNWYMMPDQDTGITMHSIMTRNSSSNRSVLPSRSPKCRFSQMMSDAGGALAALSVMADQGGLPSLKSVDECRRTRGEKRPRQDSSHRPSHCERKIDAYTDRDRVAMAHPASDLPSIDRVRPTVTFQLCQWPPAGMTYMSRTFSSPTYLAATSLGSCAASTSLILALSASLRSLSTCSNSRRWSLKGCPSIWSVTGRLLIQTAQRWSSLVCLVRK
mmetsp:Transcript_6632/g.18575  ORF Transcript_6632/g.18575 Transcript_6632/m.18575 type:complete len:215 (+) Transcript_6632:1359-2003(+)